MILMLFSSRLVAKDESQPLMQVRFGLQPLGDEFGLEDDGREDLGVRVKSNRRATPTNLAHFFQRRSRLATRKLLLPFYPTPFDPGDQTVGERSDYRGAN